MKQLKVEEQIKINLSRWENYAPFQFVEKDQAICVMFVPSTDSIILKDEANKIRKMIVSKFKATECIERFYLVEGKPKVVFLAFYMDANEQQKVLLSEELSVKGHRLVSVESYQDSPAMCRDA